MNPAAIAEALRAIPMHEFAALATGSIDRPPTVSGFYSRWQAPGAFQGVPALRIRVLISLLYVGIAPVSATSQSTWESGAWFATRDTR